MSDTIFNYNNTEWKTGNNKLILGQRLGLYDSVNTSHPRLLNLFKLQKSMDWSESEVPLEQSRMDLLTCPKAVSEVMILNLSWQWEIDSIACRSFAVLLAPFITNSEFWLMQLKFSEIEGLHGLTYSEIIRQCIPDPKIVFKSILNNHNITDRSPILISTLLALQKAGAEYTLGIIENDQELFDVVFLGIISMYLLERVQFMSSFASTFAIAEQGYMIGICKLVQRIALDEINCHAEGLKYVLSSMLENDPRAQETMRRHETKIRDIYQEVIDKEYAWSRYIFSEGRKMVGLNPTVLNEWVDYNAYFAYRTLNLVPENLNIKNPLKFMEQWLNIDSTQNAQQESSGNNYLLQTVLEDITDNEELDF